MRASCRQRRCPRPGVRLRSLAGHARTLPCPGPALQPCPAPALAGTPQWAAPGGQPPLPTSQPAARPQRPSACRCPASRPRPRCTCSPAPPACAAQPGADPQGAAAPQVSTLACSLLAPRIKERAGCSVPRHDLLLLGTPLVRAALTHDNVSLRRLAGRPPWWCAAHSRRCLWPTPTAGSPRPAGAVHLWSLQRLALRGLEVAWGPLGALDDLLACMAQGGPGATDALLSRHRRSAAAAAAAVVAGCLYHCPVDRPPPTLLPQSTAATLGRCAPRCRRWRAWASACVCRASAGSPRSR